MTPSVSQLLSWQPGQLSSAGQSLLTRAGDLQRSAGDLTSIGTRLSGVWSGAAGQAATAHHTRRSTEVDGLATTVHSAGRALIDAAEAIGPARSSLHAAMAAAAAAGCTVLDDGTVLPPPRPSMPAGLDEAAASAWQAQADVTAAANAATAARLQAQIRAALAAAGAADDGSAAALSALQPPRISPPPRAVPMGFTGGSWGPLPMPSCSTTQPTASASAGRDEDRPGGAKALGGVGSGPWTVAPGFGGDVVGWLPFDAAQTVDDVTGRRQDDVSQWYGPGDDEYRGLDGPQGGLAAADVLGGLVAGGVLAHNAGARSGTAAMLRSQGLLELRRALATDPAHVTSAQWYRRLDDAHARVGVADDLARNADDLRASSRTVPVKLGGGLAVVGIGYDIHAGKDPLQAVTAGGVGFGASVLAGAAIGTAIPVPVVGTVVGAVVGAGVGIFASGMVDGLFEDGPDVGAAAARGWEAVTDTGSAIGDGAAAAAGTVSRWFD